MLNAILAFVGLTLGGGAVGAVLTLLGAGISAGFDRLLDKAFGLA